MYGSFLIVFRFQIAKQIFEILKKAFLCIYFFGFSVCQLTRRESSIHSVKLATIEYRQLLLLLTKVNFISNIYNIAIWFCTFYSTFIESIKFTFIAIGLFKPENVFLNLFCQYAIPIDRFLFFCIPVDVGKPNLLIEHQYR